MPHTIHVRTPRTGGATIGLVTRRSIEFDDQSMPCHGTHCARPSARTRTFAVAIVLQLGLVFCGLQQADSAQLWSDGSLVLPLWVSDLAPDGHIWDWRRQTDGVRPTASADGSKIFATILVSSPYLDIVLALDARNGSVIWTTSILPGQIYPAPVVLDATGNYAYVSSVYTEHSRRVADMYYTSLHEIDTRTGNLTRTLRIIASNDRISFPIIQFVRENLIFVGCKPGVLVNTSGASTSQDMAIVWRSDPGFSFAAAAVSKNGTLFMLITGVGIAAMDSQTLAWKWFIRTSVPGIANAVLVGEDTIWYCAGRPATRQPVMSWNASQGDSGLSTVTLDDPDLLPCGCEFGMWPNLTVYTLYVSIQDTRCGITDTTQEANDTSMRQPYCIPVAGIPMASAGSAIFWNSRVFDGASHRLLTNWSFEGTLIAVGDQVLLVQQKSIFLAFKTCSCPAGHFCTSYPPQPVLCPPGMFCPKDTITPLSCATGHACPAGCTIPIVCQPGTYQPYSNATACIPCELGFYTSSNGSLSCTNCPIDTTTFTLGARSIHDCKPPQSKHVHLKPALICLLTLVADILTVLWATFRPATDLQAKKLSVSSTVAGLSELRIILSVLLEFVSCCQFWLLKPSFEEFLGREIVTETQDYICGKCILLVGVICFSLPPSAIKVSSTEMTVSSSADLREPMLDRSAIAEEVVTVTNSTECTCWRWLRKWAWTLVTFMKLCLGGLCATLLALKLVIFIPVTLACAWPYIWLHVGIVVLVGFFLIFTGSHLQEQFHTEHLRRAHVVMRWSALGVSLLIFLNLPGLQLYEWYFKNQGYKTNLLFSANVRPSLQDWVLQDVTDLKGLL